MKKKSGLLGKSISKPEVTGITAHGLWILSRGVEYFAPFVDFPWFRHAVVADVYTITEPHLGHLYWPRLDVDLHIESLVNPASFPLVSKNSAAKPLKRRIA
jgi:Protein of unknown function (DUF2442)